MWLPSKPGLIGAAGFDAGPTFEYLNTVNTGGSATTYTATDENIGVATSDRLIIGACSWQRQDSGCTFSSATIGGISATEVVTADASLASVEIGAAMFQAVVPTGTTATISITLGTDARGFQLDLWSLKDYNSATPVDTFGQNSSGVDSLSDTINVSAGGVVLAHTANRENRTITWTGLTERSDNPSYDPNIGSSAADETGVAGGTLFVEADTDSDTSCKQALVIGSWR